MNSERTAQLQVALASYDLKELRVQKRYLQEQGTAIDCTCFCSGEKLLAQLQTEGYQIETVGLMEVAPVHLSEKVTAALFQGLRENGLPLKTLPSGAGHDSMFISQVTDVGMLFAPSKNGRSHCPEEFTSAGDIAKCCDVAYTVLKELDRD